MEDEAHREKGGQSMIFQTQQQVEQAKEKNDPTFAFATVAEVHSDGISLYLGGDKVPTQKHYKCNTFCKFEIGQKVYIQKAGGEYVVLFPIGNPATELRVDSAEYANKAKFSETAETANKATTAETANKATISESIENSATGYAAIKLKMPYTNQLEYKMDGYDWNVLEKKNN